VEVFTEEKYNAVVFGVTRCHNEDHGMYTFQVHREREKCFHRGQISSQFLLSTTHNPVNIAIRLMEIFKNYFNPTRRVLNFVEGLTRLCKTHVYLCLCT
jgi:hypothetical protein